MTWKRGISIPTLVTGVLLSRSYMDALSIIRSEIWTHVWLVNSTTAILTLAVVGSLTPRVEDILTHTQKAANAKLLQLFERVEAELTTAAFRDRLKDWDRAPPPYETLWTPKLMELTACLQVMLFQRCLRERRAVFTLSLNSSLFLNTDFLIGFTGIRYGVLCPAFILV